MNHVVGSLAPHLPLALAAVTLLLALGCGCLCLAQSPAHRQRIGELTLAAVLGWLVLAAIPLPRLLHSDAPSPGSGGVDESTTRSSSKPLANRPDQGIMRDLLLVQPRDATGQGGLVEIEPANEEKQPLHALEVTRSAALAPNAVQSDNLAPRHSARAEHSALDHGSETKWLELVAWIYLGGAAVAAFWLLLGHALLARERFTAAAPPVWLYRIFQRAASSCGGRLARLVVSRRCSRPLSWGVLRPMIALPERLCQPGNRDQLRTILLHEMGHVRRGDARGNLLFEIAWPLLFFHPLFWWLRGQVRLAAELLADDCAARETGKETYVAQLVDLARGSRARRLSLVTGTGVLSNPSQFYRRMQMLLAREKPLTTHPSLVWRLASVAGLAIAVALGAALAGVNPAVGQQPDSSAAKKIPQAAAGASAKPETPDTPLLGVGGLPNSLAKDEPTEPAATRSSAAEKPDASDSTLPALAPPTVEGKLTPTLHAPPTLPKPTSEDAGAMSNRSAALRVKLRDQIQTLTAKLNALDATEQEVKAIEAAHNDGAVTLDLLLQAKQRQIDAEHAANAAAAGATKAGQTVILTRVDENGHLLQERWTTDAQGKPSGIISKTQVAGDSLILHAKPGVVNGNVVVKQFTDKEGKNWLHAYELKSDGSSGRLIEARQLAANEHTPVGMPSIAAAGGFAGEPTMPAAVPPSADASNGTPAIHVARPSAGAPLPSAIPSADNPYQPVPVGREYPLMARSGASDVRGAADSSRPLDLVALATTYADAVGAVDMAKAKLAEAKGREPLESYQAALKSAIRKEALLRRIAEVAAGGAKQEYERAVKLHATGVISIDQFNEIQSRAEILKQILGARGDSDSETDSSSRARGY